MATSGEDERATGGAWSHNRQNLLMRTPGPEREVEPQRCSTDEMDIEREPCQQGRKRYCDAPSDIDEHSLEQKRQRTKEPLKTTHDAQDHGRHHKVYFATDTDPATALVPSLRRRDTPRSERPESLRDAYIRHQLGNASHHQEAPSPALPTTARVERNMTPGLGERQPLPLEALCTLLGTWR